MVAPPTLNYVNRSVGAFILIAAAILGAAVIQSGRIHAWFNPGRPFEVLLPPEGSFGLQAGAQVKMLGTEAGHVLERTLEAGESPAAAAARLVAPLTGLEVRLGPELLTIRHGVTRYRITLVCYEADHLRGEFQSAFYRQGRWLRPDQVAGYPVSSPQRRLAQALGKGPRQRSLFDQAGDSC